MTIIDNKILQKCKLTLDDDIAKHAKWIIKNIYHKEFKNEKDNIRKFGIARVAHGGQHISRTAIFGRILGALVFKKQCELCKEEILAQSYDISLCELMLSLAIDKIKEYIKQLKILQVVLLLHDSGREGDDEDLWDQDSAINCYKYLTKVLQLDKDEAIKWAERVANKSFKKISKYKKLQVIKDKNDKEQFNWLEVNKSTQESDDIFRDIIHDADALDIMRTPKGKNFDVKRLYLYCKYKDENHTLKLLKNISNDAKKLIKKQDIIFGFYNKSILNKKKTYENSEDCYVKTLGDVINSYNYSYLFNLFYYIPRIVEEFSLGKDLFYGREAVTSKGQEGMRNCFVRKLEEFYQVVTKINGDRQKTFLNDNVFYHYIKDNQANDYESLCKNSIFSIIDIIHRIFAKEKGNQGKKWPEIAEKYRLFLIKQGYTYSKELKIFTHKNKKMFKLNNMGGKEKYIYFISQLCKLAPVFITTKMKGKIHFLLTGIDIPRALNKRGISITGSELRSIYRNRFNDSIIDRIIFWKQSENPYNKDKIYIKVAAPWITNPKLWNKYKPKSHGHIAFQIAVLFKEKVSDKTNEEIKTVEAFFNNHYKLKYKNDPNYENKMRKNRQAIYKIFVARLQKKDKKFKQRKDVQKLKAKLPVNVQIKKVKTDIKLAWALGIGTIIWTMGFSFIPALATAAVITAIKRKEVKLLKKMKKLQITGNIAIEKNINKSRKYSSNNYCGIFRFRNSTIKLLEQIGNDSSSNDVTQRDLIKLDIS